MDVEAVIAGLRDPAAIEQGAQALAAWGDDADPKKVQYTLSWIGQVRRELADLCELIGNEDDVSMIVAVKHMEFKAHWIMLNTRVNYSLMSGEGFNEGDAFRGAVLSLLIDELEPHLPEKHVEAFHAILAEPLERKITRVVDPDAAAESSEADASEFDGALDPTGGTLTETVEEIAPAADAPEAETAEAPEADSPAEADADAIPEPAADDAPAPESSKVDVPALVAGLRAPAAVEEQATAALAAWGDDADPQDVRLALSWITQVRREMSDLCELIGDPDDVSMICAVKHMEFKAHWIMLNTRTNYSLMSGNGIDEQDAFRGCVLSLLIDELEGYLPAKHVEAFHAILAEPLTRKITMVVDPDAIESSTARMAA